MTKGKAKGETGGGSSPGGTVEFGEWLEFIVHSRASVGRDCQGQGLWGVRGKKSWASQADFPVGSERPGPGRTLSSLPGLSIFGLPHQMPKAPSPVC